MAARVNRSRWPTSLVVASALGCAEDDAPIVATHLGAPRPLTPLSLGEVTRRRPTLRWALPAGADGARVELCADRACERVLETLDAPGTQARPARELPARSPVFWRMRARAGRAVGVAQSPTWLFHVPAGSSTSVADTSTAPRLDVNGDGVDDVVVGAPSVNHRHWVEVGAVRVYHGAASGPGETPTPYLEGVDPHGRFGSRVASAGDVDGDGFGDLVVAAEGPCDRAQCRGAAHVFRGGARGLVERPAIVLEGTALPNRIAAVEGVGDVNGDGFADVLVAWRLQRRDGDNVSFATTDSALYLGSADGTRTTPAWRSHTLSLSVDTVSSAGDVNGDGYSDLVAASPWREPGDYLGRVQVFPGGPTGIAATPAITLRGTEVGGALGAVVASAGDVNSDGYSDVVVCATLERPQRGASRGVVRVFHGSASGLTPTPAVVLTRAARDAVFGVMAAGAGDVNGDGQGDLAVVTSADSIAPSPPSVTVYHGARAGLSTSPAIAVTWERARIIFQGTLAHAGDVNGDGYSDLLAGGTTQVGLFYGGPSGITDTPSRTYSRE